MAAEKTKKKSGDDAGAEPDGEATLAGDALDEAQEGEHETEGEGAEPEETSKGDYLSEQRRREDLATDVARDFPDKYRLSGTMEGCSDEQKLELLERLVKLRLFDARMRKLFRQGRFEGTYYSQIGQEACDAVLTYQMKKTDFVGPSHRDLGASVGKGVPLKFLAAQVYNRVDSPDEGRYTACHYWHPEYWIMQPSTSIMMNWIAPTGAAFGFKTLGTEDVAAASGGDGATAHGD
ncbi:MAG: thiamine pyrophosphate-dependent enzyme, partial [Gemmatimonadota bacterium]|nr:thiamine pyrophosphate-dependent enzyme [Gemmatimonadota bacterium]